MEEEDGGQTWGREERVCRLLPLSASALGCKGGGLSAH